jgi:hypothetical protein
LFGHFIRQHSDVLECLLDAARIMTNTQLLLLDYKNAHLQTSLALLTCAHHARGTHADRESGIQAITSNLGAPAMCPWTHDFQRVDEWEEFVRNLFMLDGPDVNYPCEMVSLS